MSSFAADSRPAGDAVVVSLTGDLDLATVDYAYAAFRRAARESRLMVVDLRRLDFIGVVGLRLLLAGAARRALQLRFRDCEPRRLGDLDGPLEAGGPAAVVDRRAEALELVRGRVVEPGGDQQAVERQLDVVAARAAVADRDPELLLDRR